MDKLCETIQLIMKHGIRTRGNLDDEGDRDADGEDEHGDDDDAKSVDGLAGFSGSSAARKRRRRLFRNWGVNVAIEVVLHFSGISCAKKDLDS